MTTTWEQIRQECSDAGHRDRKRLEAPGRWQLDRVRAHRLAEIRKALGMNQVDVAKRIVVPD